MLLLTSAQMREIESRAITTLSIPSLLLMENAALQTAKHIPTPTNIVIVCGPGNNGGDGLAIARLLHARGSNVKVAFVGDTQKNKGDAKTNLEIVKKMDLLSTTPLQDLLTTAKITIDALFGTGLKGAPTSEAAQAIKTINKWRTHSNKQVISVDIPSGVEADTGKVHGEAIRADTTITFGLAKIGHILYPGTEYTGRLIVEDISIPQNILLSPDLKTIEVIEDITTLLPPRPARSNKGTFGRVCVLAGCSDMPGAAALCCKAAYKTGAGLVHACVVPEVARVIQSSAHEVITSDANQKNNLKEAITNADVIALGPGIGRGPTVQEYVSEIFALNRENKKAPMVIDADGLIAIAADKSILKNAQFPCVITPHPGEMAALTGQTIPQVLDNILDSAQSFAQEYNVVTLLKDARTVIAASDGRTFINTTGTPALAKAGSGDVLTGIIAALIAQGLPPFTAAAVGAYIHGQAGQLAAQELSLYGVTASDVITHLCIS